jgi:hypothetical protein
MTKMIRFLILTLCAAAWAFASCGQDAPKTETAREQPAASPAKPAEAPKNGPPPKLVMEKTRLNFEEHFIEGQPIQAVFEVRNEGQGPLVIQRVSPG